MLRTVILFLITFSFSTIITSQQLKFDDLVWPPTLLDGKQIAIDSTVQFLKQDPEAEIQISKDIDIAKTSPKIEFLYFPGQNYIPELWSNWNDCTTDKRNYLGDNIYRLNPITNEKEIVAYYPMPKHTIPGSSFSTRMIFYGDTIQGNNSPDKRQGYFIAYDLKNGKLIRKEPGGSLFYYIFSKSTGRLYWRTIGDYRGQDEYLYKINEGRRLDSITNAISDCPSVPYVTSATVESRDRYIYGTSTKNPLIWRFNPKTEILDTIATIAVGKQTYTCSMDLYPVTECYLYYVLGAHGGIISEDLSIIQYDLKEKKHKILAFVDRYYKDRYGYSPDDTFSTALSADSGILHIIWNGNRAIPVKGKRWDTTTMVAIYTDV